MTRHHQHTRRVNPKASLIPKPLEDGKVRCPGCSRVVKPTPTGRLRMHNAPSGEPCAVRTVVLPNQVALEVVPDVTFRKGQDPRMVKQYDAPIGPKRPAAKGKERKPVRVRTGYCSEDGCEKFIGPDRWYCGQHLIARGSL